MGRKLRMGMVGGGPGAFIGEVHRKAVRLDGRIELVAGVFASDPAKSRKMGETLGLPQDRVYADCREMIERESKLPADVRIDFVSIATPNHMHFPAAKAFLEAGFNVMCEKPMTLSLDEAKELQDVVKRGGKVFGLMHNYTGYPMVKLARDLIKGRRLGKLRRVDVSYRQGWLARPIERAGQTQASWRTDPKRSGAAGCLGDIGSHCENIAEYVTGLRITHVCADLTSFVEGRALDDDGNALLRFEDGVRGVLSCSQIAVGEENGLSLRVYGTEAGVEWHQEHPDQLLFKPLDGPVQTWSRGNPYVAEASPAAARGTRLPPGHPEAFIEAFANVYSGFADAILGTDAATAQDFPSSEAGARGLAFIEACVSSAKSECKWIEL